MSRSKKNDNKTKINDSVSILERKKSNSLREYGITDDITLQGILRETESIRSKYIKALDNFEISLEPLEDKYKAQLKKLESFAKSDPGLAREIGKLEILVTEKEKILHDYFKSSDRQTPQHIKKYFPVMSSFGKEALFDLYQCFSNSQSLAPVMMKIHEPAQKKDKNSSINSLVFHSENKNYSFAANKRRLIIPKLFTKELNKKITDELALSEFGLFLLVPADVDVRNAQKITRYKQSLLVRECRRASGYYSSYWKTLKKDDITDAILYRCGKDTRIETPQNRNRSLGVKINYKSKEVPELLRPFVKSNYTEKYLEQYIKNMGKFNDDISFIFSLTGKDRLYFKFGDKNVMISK
ncbi:hypothetical protein JW756_00045 [Candidatus Woesearchaeota archaeon]|nr:hypothetical protein [Candidatus Woesearchaeota archaeon]